MSGCLRLALMMMVWHGLVGSVAAQQKNGPLGPSDYDGYRKYFSGVYKLVGQLPHSTASYSGKVVLAGNGKEFKVTRTVGGKTTDGRAYVDLDASGNRVFVMQFSQDGRRYEATYLFMSNYDSYPRLTGQIARTGKSKDSVADHGVEALFPADDPACAVREQ